jgi:hypothetical protein
MYKYLLILCTLFGFNHVLACGEIIPNKRITTIVVRLAYKDFPKAADIFAHIRVESSFNPKARNTSEREDSVGLMQVQNGPKNERLNIAMGVSLLREYYEITHNKEAASKAYNIGIGNYSRGKLKISATNYYEKIKLWTKVYEDYPKRMHYLGPNLGCNKYTEVDTKLQIKSKILVKEVGFISSLLSLLTFWGFN